MKIERYIREYAAALKRDKAISKNDEARSTIDLALKFRERGNLTASETMQILFISAFNPSKRLTLASISVYYDTENDELITLDQLRQEWKSMTQEEKEERGSGSFDDFLEACMCRNNGTLIHFSEWIAHRLKEREA